MLCALIAENRSDRPGSAVITYPVIKVHAERRGRCPVCHRWVLRRATFENSACLSSTWKLTP